MDNYSNFILYDWLSFTTSIHTIDSMIDMLGLDFNSFQTLKGFNGYTDRLYYDGISIHFGGRDEIWIEMSGQGCRAFESYGTGAWDTLLDEICSNGKDYNITRLDVAFDDKSEILDIDLLFREVDNGNFVSKFKYWEITKSSKGTTIYFGSPQSDVRFRIYDKARERSFDGEHWIRFELQLRDKSALNFVNLNLLRDIGKVFTGVINNYLRFVIPSGDSNKWRWKTADYWSKFINTVEQYTLYISPGTDYNLAKLENYVVNQAGSAAATYIEIFGVDDYLDKVNDKLASSRNPKYKEIISKSSVNVI